MVLESSHQAMSLPKLDLRITRVTETLMAAINNSAAAENPASKKRKVESPTNNEEDIDDDQVVGDELADDPFERLPDETIVEILVRVNDEKSLRRCVALNKHMSCLVPLIDPFSIHIHPDPWLTNRKIKIRHYNNNVKVVGKLLFDDKYGFPPKDVFCDTHLIYNSGTRPPSVEEIIQYYIKKASEYLRSRRPVGAPIHHVTVKLPPLDKTVFGYYHQRLAWNLEYSGVEGGLIKSCAVLGYFSLSGGEKENVWVDYVDDQIQIITRCMRFGAILRPMVEQMVRDHETLCRVSILTKCGMARLHIAPEEIRVMRRWVNNKINGLSSIMKLNMKIWYCGIGLVLVTDPDSHHNTEDVKGVIGSVLDRTHTMHDKNIKKMRRMMMKNKKMLPPCIFQAINSEWQWSCEI